MSIELIVLAVIGVAVVLMFNSLIVKKNEIENAVGGVHSYLQKRADLIPSVVATVKQFAAHEEKLLTELTKARAGIQGRLSDEGDLQKADSLMSSMLGKVVAVAENYPELRSNENFLRLQGSLNEIEGQLSAARRTYNAAVVRYNNAVESIPTNMIAGLLGYRRKAVFQVAPEAAAKPDIAKLFGQVG
jgi:LemA protein